MPNFFPFNQKNNLSRVDDKDESNSLKYFTRIYNEMADLADAYERVKKHNLVGIAPHNAVISNSSMAYTNFPNSIGQFPNHSDIYGVPVTGFTGFACPGCKKVITMPWTSSTPVTAKASHESSCKQGKIASKTLESHEMQSLNDTLTKNLISYTENLIKPKRYVECLEFNDFMEMSFAKLFYTVDMGIVPKGHWAERACNNQKTEISDAEMKEFIAKARASFAIFKVALDTNVGYYLMMIGH
jgi:hypothetical protein